MESKIIQISTSVDEQGSFIAALCEDGSVWTSDKNNSFQLLEKPFKPAQKKEEALDTSDNTDYAAAQKALLEYLKKWPNIF